MRTTYYSAHGLLTVHLTQFITDEYIMNVTSDTLFRLCQCYRSKYYIHIISN